MTRNVTFTLQPGSMKALTGKYGILKCHNPKCKKLLKDGNTVHSIQIKVDRTFFSETTRIYYCIDCWNEKYI